MSKVIILEAEVGSIRILKDRSVSFNLHTPELSDERMVMLTKLSSKYISALLKEDSVQPTDADLLIAHKPDPDDIKKSPSQRLRSVLYVSWEQNPEGFKLFSDYYEFRMTKLIELIKSKLD